MPSPIVVSYSELDTFRQCPLKHALAYKQRWTKPPVVGNALDKGTRWHNVMEAHYQVIRDMSRGLTSKALAKAEMDILNQARLAVRPYYSTGDDEVDDLIQWMYEGYVDMWGIDPQWQILATEHSVKVRLHNDQGRPTRFLLKAKIDLLVRDRLNGMSWVVDHKSGKDLPRSQELDLDDQFGLYTYLMRRIKRPVTGSMHNAARTYRLKTKEQALDERFSRTPMNRTETELRNIEIDAWRAARAAYSAMNEIPYSSPDPRQCGWKCDFREVHLMARKGMDIDQALVDHGFRIDKTRH